MFRQIGDDFARAVALKNLGSANDSLHNEPKAIEYYEQSLALVRKPKDRRGEGRSLLNIGEANIEMGELRRGISFYEQALAIVSQAHDRQAEGIVLSNLGAAYSRLGNYPAATGYLDRAVIVLRETKDRNAEAKAFSNLMDASARRGYIRLAIMYGKESVNLYQSIRVGITGLSADLQRSYAEGKEPIYRKLADLLIDQGRLAEAQRTLDLLKQEEFYTFVRRDAKTAGPSGRIELSPQEALWAKNSEQYLVSIAHQRGELFAKEQRSPEEEALLARPDQLDPRPLAQELFGILIGDSLREDLRQAKAETVMWSLDGALRYVPLAALYDGKQYLVEQFRLEVFTPESKDRLKDAPTKQWTAAAFGVTKAHRDFAALPQVAEELRGIIRRAPDGRHHARRIKVG